MALTQYTDLLPDVLSHVMACPRPQILRALQTQSSYFFQESQAYTHPVVETVDPGVSSITVADLPEQTRLVAPLDMQIDGQPLSTTNQQIMTNKYGNYLAEEDRNPEYVFATNHMTNMLTVVPMIRANGVSGEITGLIAIKPIRLASGMEETIMEEFADGIVSGALSKLFMVKNSEWYDPNLSMEYKAEFERAILKAKQARMKGNTSLMLTTGYGGY